MLPKFVAQLAEAPNRKKAIQNSIKGWTTDLKSWAFATPAAADEVLEPLMELADQAGKAG